MEIMLIAMRLYLYTYSLIYLIYFKQRFYKIFSALRYPVINFLITSEDLDRNYDRSMQITIFNLYTYLYKCMENNY